MNTIDFFVGGARGRAVGIVAALMLLAAAAFVAQNPQPTKQENADEEGVRAAIDNYFKGHATGDATHMRKAFLTTAHIEGIREGKLTSWTVDVYCENFKGNPADDESSRKRTIDSIDVVGTAAMAKATLVHGRSTFTDYFVLLKVDGEWKIANKVYHRH